MMKTTTALSLAGLALAAASTASAVPTAKRVLPSTKCVDAACRVTDPNSFMHSFWMAHKQRQYDQYYRDGKFDAGRASQSITGGDAEGRKCEGGEIEGYFCWNTRLMSYLNNEDLGSSFGEDETQVNFVTGYTIPTQDSWGWTDPVTGKEWALITQGDGTSFVDISDPVNPVAVAYIKNPSGGRGTHHDVKVYKDHAYIVAEISGHGILVYDLTQLRELREEGDFSNGPEVVLADSQYTEHGSSHNIWINEETGFAYSVGTDTCNAGLHIVDIRDPANPEFAGCYSEDGYTHDVECIVYNGPDKKYQGKEICHAYNEDTITIVDVTDHANPVTLSRTVPYYEADVPNGIFVQQFYVHQGFFTPDQRYLITNDELDEYGGAVAFAADATVPGSNPPTGSALAGPGFRTFVFDALSLEAPVLVDTYDSDVVAADHNLYVINTLAFEANYAAGMRVLDIQNVAKGELHEVAYFDVYPEEDVVEYIGAWNVYPYFKSGNILISSFDRGMFVVRMENSNGHFDGSDVIAPAQPEAESAPENETEPIVEPEGAAESASTLAASSASCASDAQAATVSQSTFVGTTAALSVALAAVTVGAAGMIVKQKREVASLKSSLLTSDSENQA